jgi:hypothetical protein
MNLLTFGSPRIEVVLSLAKGGTLEAGPFEAWLVLTVPDGKPATLLQLAGGPFDQNSAYLLMHAVFTHIGEKFAKPEALKDAKELERDVQRWTL